MTLSLRTQIILSLCFIFWLSNANANSAVLIRIENISEQSRLPIELSQGVWLLHQQPGQIFEPGQPDFDNGLEALAEDGLPEPLRNSLLLNPQVVGSGVFNVTADGVSAVSILPGEAFEFILFPTSTEAELSFAAAVGAHNDAFIAPTPQGISLFDAGGNLITGDVTDQLFLWDTGTETNEATGSGPNQIFVQAAAGDGARPETVRRFTDSTHAFPLADRIAQISVSESAGQFTINVENSTNESNAVSSALSPGLFFLQDSTFELFAVGSQNIDSNLETFAEDGDPFELGTSLTGLSSVDQVIIEGTGPLFPGDSYEVTLTPSSQFPNLNFLTNIVSGNDAFLGLGPSGVRLVDGSGIPRPIADIEQDLVASLKLYDLGTEKNQIPGSGPNQLANQSSGNSGLPDANNQIRIYSDRTNLFDSLSNFAALTIVNDNGLNFLGNLENSNGGEDNLILAQPIWFVHDGAFQLFEPGQMASPALVQAATNGDVGLLLDLLSNSSSISDFGQILTQGSPVLAPGQNESFPIATALNSRFINIFSLIAPSNDTFLSLGEIGVALLDEQNNPRSDVAITQDIQQALSVWDAGAERNEAGAAGPNQVPQQPTPTSGLSEAEGTVELFDDPIWGRHRIENIVRVTVSESDAVFIDSFES